MREEILKLPEEESEEILNMMVSFEKKGYEKGKREGIEQGIEQGIEKGMEKGIKRGIQEGKMVSARKMLLKGMDENLVQEITELPIGIIEKIKKEIHTN